METVILTGGFDTHISEESHLKPKPMIEIGGKPILWHIMKMYTAHGYNEAVYDFHKSHGRVATITTVNVPQRFGVIDMDDAGAVTRFKEKSADDAHRINGGFMCMSPKVLDYIEGDHTMLEREPLEAIAQDGQLAAYRHEGFWQCMDTQRDKQTLEAMWEEGSAPWRVW